MPVTGEYTFQISDSPEDTQWDRFLSNQPGGIFEQSSLWARAKALYGWQPLRLVVKQGGQIVAGFQLLRRKVLKFGHIAYLSKGPVFDQENSMDEAVPLVLNHLKKMVKQHHIYILIVHPASYSDPLMSQMATMGFAPTELVNVVRATLVIDLSQPIEEIFKQMKSRMRYKIRQGLRKGIKIRSGTKADIPKFFSLMLNTCKRQGVSPNPADEKFFRRLWHLFRPLGGIKLFLAEYNNETVAGAWIIPFGDTARYWKIGWSGKYGNLRPNQLLIWESIKWTKEQGYAYFDFFGISQSAAEKMKANISVSEKDVDGRSWHKLRFGGNPILFPPAYEYIYNPWLKFAYRHFLSKIMPAR